MWAGTTGAALGPNRSRYGRGSLRLVLPVVGWGLAVLQHATWNSALSGFESGWAALGALLLGIMLFVLIWRLALRRERGIMREQLADEVPAGVLSSDEYETLWNDTRRRQALRAARTRGGGARPPAPRPS